MKLLERAKAILFTPRTEWRVIEQESSGMSELYLGYVAILAAIPELANLVGQSMVGAYKPLGPALARAVVAYAATLAAVYLVAVVIDVLAPRFGGKKSWPNAFKLSVYSHTPLWLSGIFLLIPGLSFLMIVGGLLGFHLLRIGLPLLMHARPGVPLCDDRHRLRAHSRAGAVDDLTGRSELGVSGARVSPEGVEPETDIPRVLLRGCANCCEILGCNASHTTGTRIRLRNANVCDQNQFIGCTTNYR